jgi:hypothetical protein
MGARAQYEIPAGLKDVRERFEQWRSTQTGRRPIPESLWRLASELAGQHGIFRTQVLRLDYTKLKQLVPKTAPAETPTPAPQPAFVELIASSTAHPCACILEVEGPRGRMRVEWKGLYSAGLGRSESCAVGAGRLIQIMPQIRILVAVEPIDARKGIDSPVAAGGRWSGGGNSAGMAPGERLRNRTQEFAYVLELSLAN